MKFLFGASTAVLLIGSLVFQSCSQSSPSEPVLSDKFSDIQKRLITPTCGVSGCHGGDFPSALLDLTADSAYKSLMTHEIQNSVAIEKYRALVVPGKPDSSFLYIKITNPVAGEGDRMPQRLDKLPQNEIDAIRSWISRGAPND